MNGIQYERRWRKFLPVVILGIVFMSGGCQLATKSTVYVPNSRRIVALEPNEPAPFAGVLITRGRHSYLLRCEDEVLSRGILP